MNPALVIAAKDLRERVRDNSAISIAVVLPLVLGFVFNFILGGATGESAFRYAVFDADEGEIAAGFVNEVLPAIEEEGFIAVVTADSVAQARQMALDGRVAAAFVIPAGFSQDVQDGAPVSLRVIGSVDSPIATAVAGSIAEGYAAEIEATGVSVATALQARGGEGNAQELAARAAQSSSPLIFEDISATKKELSVETFFAAGMAVFFLFFTVQSGVTSLLQERSNGTLARLFAAPISRASVLGAKLLTSIVMGVTSMTILVIASTLLLGAEWGSPAAVGVLIVAGVLAATAITAVVATLAKNAEQAGNYQSVVAVVMGLLGGTFFPVAQAGGVIASLSLLTPHAWFMRGLADISGGGGVEAVLPATLVLLAFAALTGTVALLRADRLARL